MQRAERTEIQSRAAGSGFSLLTALAATACAGPAQAIHPAPAATTGETPLDQAADSEHRVSNRVHVLFAASIEADGAENPALLRNVSCTGALVETQLALRPGAALLFKRGDARIPATVIWANGGRLGLSFETPIDDGLVQLLAHRLRPLPASRAKA
jgi:hypothetical protein